MNPPEGDDSGGSREIARVPPITGMITANHLQEKKLKRKMRELEMRLDLASNVVVRSNPVIPDVSRGVEEVFPYYLQQPKAKASNYMRPNEIIIFRTNEGWERAKLVSKQNEYRESGYDWTFTILRTGEIHSAHLGQGKNDWGALRNEDLALDYTKMDLQVPSGRKQRTRLVSECATCKETNMSIYPEERNQLMSFIPFSCRHNKEVSGLETVGQGEPNEVFSFSDIPRPLQPRIEGYAVPLSFEGSQASSFAVVKITQRMEEIEEVWNMLASMFDQLEEACQGVSEDDYPGFNLGQMRIQSRTLEIEVNKLLHRGEAIYSQLSQLEPINLSAPRNVSVVNTEEVQIETPDERRGQLRQFTPVEEESVLDLRLGREQEDVVPAFTYATSHHEEEWVGPRVERPMRREQEESIRPRPRPDVPGSRGERVNIEIQNIPSVRGESIQLHTRKISSKIQRNQDRIIAEWSQLELQLERGRSKLCSLDQARFWREEVSRLEDKLSLLEDQYEEELAFMVDSEQTKARREGEEAVRRLRERFQDAPAKISAMMTSTTARATQSTPTIHSRTVSRLERVSLPRFSGRIEDFAVFQHLFVELTQAEDYSDVILMVQLRERIPKEAVALLAGVVDVKEAWERLGRRYGDREQAILQAMHRLKSSRMGSGPAYEQIDNLRLAVQTARAHLRAVGAEDELFSDRSIFGHLILKVPYTYQERWHLLTTDMVNKTSTETKGQMFTKWLEKEGEAANSARLMKMSASYSREDNMGNTTTSRTRDVPTLGSFQTDSFAADGSGYNWRERLNTREGASEVKEALLKRVGVCPACKKNHSYARKFSWGTDEWPSQRLEACPTFVAFTPAVRAKLIEDEGGCGLCTSTSHVVKKCFSMDKFRMAVNDPKCKEVSTRGGGVCGKLHHRLVHGSGNVYCQANLTVTCHLDTQMEGGTQITEVEVEEGMESATFVTRADVIDRTTRCLFEHLVVPVMAEGGNVQREIVLTDTAANTNFITHGLARELGAKGTYVEYSLKVVDSQYRKRKTLAYTIAIIDRQEEKHWIYALGVDVITDANPPPSLREARRIFPQAPAEVFKRPVGPVRILISMTERHLHSSGGEEIGSLRLAPTPLGCGWVLTGLVPIQGHPLPLLSGEVCALIAGQMEPPLQASMFNIQVSSLEGVGFQEAEGMGYQPPPMCSGCKSCRLCEESRTKVSQDDRLVLERVEKEMKLDPEQQILRAQYPWKPCAYKMTDNYVQALKVQSSIEKRQLRDGRHAEYVEEFGKLVEKGALRRLTVEEMRLWEGPVNYNALFSVYKESSVSTKTRIVSNSAQKNQHSGLSLNECMFQGPDCLASMLDVLLHWRVVEESIIMDLEKAYQAIHTGDGLELHLRRIVFRKSPDQEWQVYAFTRATFGDLAAGLLLEVAKKRAAKEGELIDPFAARQLVRFTYVDDGLPGGSKADVTRMLGDDGPGTMSKILATCGLKAKFMVRTGDSDPEAAAHLGGKVLGIGYHLASDEIRMAVPMGPLNPQVSGDKNPLLLTKRKVLSFLMSAFDPLGLLSPILLEGKILLRMLYGEDNPGWDQPLAPSQQLAWKRWVQRIQRGPAVTFPRTTRPQGAVGKPSLVGFSDASMTATCALVYLVWETKEGEETSAKLLISKCRVTPIKGMTIPRAELQAMVILLRLIATVLRATEEKFEQVTTATDSMCILAALNKPAPSMKPYFANRVAEVWALLAELKELCPKVDFPRFVPGVLNPSDLGTREGVVKEDIGPQSVWQCGPSFLRDPRESWPLRVESGGEVPTPELRGKFCNPVVLHSDVIGLKDGIDLAEVARDLTMRCRSWTVAQGALAMIVRAVCHKERKRIDGVATPKERAVAKKIILWAHSGSAFEALEAGELLSLGAKKAGGLVIVDGRVKEEDLARILGKNVLPIILNKEPLARLILRDAHREDHNMDPQYIIARSRKEVWIPRATKTAKAIASGCMFCRAKNKKMARQLMGSISTEKTRSVAPFEVTALDMFGPFFVKDIAKGRRRFKTWAIMYCCLATKAVAIFSCPGYSTSVFLQTHSMFVSTYTPGSQPTKVYCDHGPQLMAAATSIDWEQVRKEIGCQETEWIFTPKACSWRNGACERAIRSARHTLQHVIGAGSLLDHHQLNAVFHQVAAIMNSRPISIRLASSDRFHSITPSDILLGRAARRYVDPDSFEPWKEDDVEVAEASSRQHKVVTLWWKAWLNQSFQDLVPRSKWMQEHRNVAIGDICHIIYKNRVGSPLFRLCRITKISPDDKKLVRTCTVKFYNRDIRNRGDNKYLPGNYTYLETAIQRLAVLLPAEEQEGGGIHDIINRPLSQESEK